MYPSFRYRVTVLFLTWMTEGQKHQHFQPAISPLPTSVARINPRVSKRPQHVLSYCSAAWSVVSLAEVDDPAPVF